MGIEKYQKDIERLFKKSPVVSYKSIEKIIKNKKNVKQYAKQLVRNLLLKEKIKKLAKGYYTIHDDPSLCVFCFKPAYLGLHDALSLHELWEQETIPVVITARKTAPGIRKVIGGNVLIKRIDKQYLFGYDYFPQKDIYLPYSDIEKTFIDMLYFKERMDRETAGNIIRKIDVKKFDSYLKAYPKRMQKRVRKYKEMAAMQKR